MSMNRTKISEIIASIFMVLTIQSIGSYVHYNMQDATPSSTELQQPTPSVELLQKEVKQLKDKLAWMESEYQKLTKLFTAQLYKKSEKHLAPGGSPWLPFKSQEEFQQARLEAEAEAQKLVDEHEAKEPIKPRKPRNESLPENLPEVKKLCDVPESNRVCPEHGPMSVIGFDTTQTLVEEPAKLYRVTARLPLGSLADNGMLAT